MTLSEAIISPGRSHSAIDRDEFEYKSLSAGALAAAILGVLSLTIFYAGRDDFFSALMLTPLPLAGCYFAVRSWGQIKASEGRLSGLRFALVGGVLSILCGLGGVAYAAYVRSTELPPGYVRTSFAEFSPDDVDVRAGRAVREQVVALDGKRVFLKGYIRPDSTPVRENIQRFLLVRDNNVCCYGEISSVKYYDQVGVAVDKGVRLDYSQGVVRIGGILHVRPENAGKSLSDLVYTLEADYAR